MEIPQSISANLLLLQKLSLYMPERKFQIRILQGFYRVTCENIFPLD